MEFPQVRILIYPKYVCPELYMSQNITRNQIYYVDISSAIRSRLVFKATPNLETISMGELIISILASHTQVLTNLP